MLNASLCQDLGPTDPKGALSLPTKSRGPIKVLPRLVIFSSIVMNSWPLVLLAFIASHSVGVFSQVNFAEVVVCSSSAIACLSIQKSFYSEFKFCQMDSEVADMIKTSETSFAVLDSSKVTSSEGH